LTCLDIPIAYLRCYYHTARPGGFNSQRRQEH